MQVSHSLGVAYRDGSGVGAAGVGALEGKRGGGVRDEHGVLVDDCGGDGSEVVSEVVSEVGAR